MRRNLPLNVKNKAEFEAIKRAMADAEVCAFVTIIGILKPLRESGRQRVLSYFADRQRDPVSVQLESK